MKIQILRRKIDKLDQQLVNTLNKRINIANKIIDIKEKNNIEIEDKEREKEILNNLPKNKLIQQIYNSIFKHIKNERTTSSRRRL